MAKRHSLFSRLREEEEETIAQAKNESATEPFIIELPASLSAETLQVLKDLLLKNKGNHPVIVHIGKAPGFKRIKVPFGISLTEGLKKKIKEVVGD